MPGTIVFDIGPKAWWDAATNTYAMINAWFGEQKSVWLIAQQQCVWFVLISVGFSPLNTDRPIPDRGW